MPARKRPTFEDTVTARRTLLDGLAHDVDIFELVSELLRHCILAITLSPAEVFLRLAADAPDCAGPAGRPPAPGGTTRAVLARARLPRPGVTRSSSMQCWRRQLFMAGPTRTCWMRSPGGRATTSGNTPCSLPSPTSRRRQPGGRAAKPGLSGSGSAFRRSGTIAACPGRLWEQSSDGGAADENGRSSSR